MFYIRNITGKPTIACSRTPAGSGSGKKSRNGVILESNIGPWIRVQSVGLHSSSHSFNILHNMFQCTSKLRAADSNIVLNLTTKHRLEYGDSDSSNTARKSRFPANIDIFPSSVIVFSFSAVLNRKPLASDVLIKSQLTHHFLEFLQSNVDQLGLGTVSALYLDAGCPKSTRRLLSCESVNHVFAIVDVSTNRTRVSFHDSVPVRVVLRSIHLHYSVSSKQTTTCDGDLDLFSTRLSLPYRSIVDNILKRFVTFHLVKSVYLCSNPLFLSPLRRRYPLIFGTVCQVTTSSISQQLRLISS